MEQSVLRLHAEGVHPSLQAIQQIKDDLEANQHTLLAKLQAAEAGDPHGYLAGGLQQGYAAVHASTTALALLDEILQNSRATVHTLEQHDQQPHATPPVMHAPVALHVTPAKSGLTPVSVAAPGVERPNIAVQPVPADVPVTPHPEPLLQPQAPLHQTVAVQSTLTGVAWCHP